MPAANLSLFQMRILNIVFLLSLCGLLNVKAQEETVVISSRAGRSTGVDVMPFRSLQLESRIEYDHGECEQVLLPGMMLRYGITKLAEIWVEYTGFYGNESDVFAYQVNPLMVGTKVRIANPHGWIPETSLQTAMSIPLVQGEEHVCLAPSILLLFDNKLLSWLNIGYNVGMEWNGTSIHPITNVSFCFDVNLSERVGFFCESYNAFQATDNVQIAITDCVVGAGVNFFPHPNVQIDVYGSCNVIKTDFHILAGVGLSWLIH